MAAQKENLVSPWRVNLTGDALDNFKRGREEGLRKSENRRMQLHCDVLKLQREQHLRAMSLQRRCQELTERERRARRRNQQLLQDFQRAEATLGEMVAHTATMNTLRLEYQRYLEENSPRWHQQLKDHTQRAEKKRLEALLKDLLKREEEHVTASFTRERFSPPRENTHWPQRATSEPEGFCRAHGRPDAFVPPMMPSSSWLTQAHTSHDAFCFPSPTVFPPPRPYPVHHQTPPQTGPPPRGAPQTNGTPPSVSSEVGSPPGLQAPGAPGAMAGPSGWGRVLGGGAEAGGGGEPDAETWGENRKGGGKSSPQELDIKPVRLSSAHGDSSDGSRDSGDGRSQGERRRRRRKEGRQPSVSDRKSSSQESAAASRSDSEVFIPPTATRGQRATRGPYSGTPSETESRRGGTSACERRARKKTQSDPDQSGSHKEKSCRTLRAKSQSAAGESSSHTTEDEDPTDQSGGSRKERGQQKDSVSVKEKSRRDLTTDAQRAGVEEAADVQGDQGENDEDAKHTDEDSSSEDEENRLMEEREEEDEEESHREEDKEEEERGEDDEGQESEASGEEEGQEQTGSSDSESEGAAMSRAKEEPENKERQAEVDDDGEELDEEEDGGGGGVGICQPQEGEPEETDSDDSIVLPQEHRSIKVQSVSEEEEANSREEEEEGEGTGGDGSVESSDSEEEEGEDIERLVAPRAETQSKQENELKSLNKTKVVKEDPQIEESLLEQSDQRVQKAEDTDDEFDHFYD